MRIIYILWILFFVGCSPLKKANFLLENSILNLKKAQSLLEAHLKKHPQDKRAKLLLARLYYQKSEFQKAFEIYEDLKGYLDPDSKIIFSKILIKKNLFEEAKKILKSIKSSDYKKEAQLLLKKIEKKISEKLPSYLEELLSKPITQQDIECGAQILLVDEVVQITPDNKEVSLVHFVARILNERGKELGEVKIEYDSTYEYIAELTAQTITKDKRVIKVGRENIRDVSKYLEFPLYSNLRVRIISMPECVPGSVIEYKVKIVRTRLINKKDFSIIYVLKEKYPIKIAKFKLIVPKNRKVNIYKRNLEFNFENFNLAPVVQEDENVKIYKWEFKNIPPIIREPNMPPISEINPYILITSFSDWKEIYNWWIRLYKDKITPSQEIKEKVRELTKKDKLSALKEIFKFCCENIRYVAVEYGRAGFTPHYAKDIFLNKYGDCKDQSILLVSMLRTAKIKAWPVLISTRGNFEIKESEPSLNFNHCIVLAKIKDKFYFLDPTAETSDIYNLPFSDQARTVLVFFDDNYRIMKTPSKKDNEIFIKMDVSFEKNKLNFKRKITTKGEFTLAQRYFLKYTHPKIFKEKLLEKAKDILKDAQLKRVEIKNLEFFYKPLILYYEFSGSMFFKDLGKYKILPSLSEVEISGRIISAQQRRYPVFLGFLRKKRIKISIPLKESFKIYFLPPQVKINSRWFSYYNKYYIQEGKLYYEELYEIKKEKVTLSEYEDFKKKFEELLFLKDIPVIFKYEEKKENTT